MFILLGIASIYYGEIDDSPGLMLIGLIIIIISIYSKDASMDSTFYLFLMEIIDIYY